MWKQIEDGKTVGTKGSENGIIILDEEYKEYCRITLEKTEKYYAINCGVFSTLHTVFVSEENYIDVRQMILSTIQKIYLMVQYMMQMIKL